jgi:polysaccharide deacetylase family protein (PEP-CTERM system associated)
LRYAVDATVPVSVINNYLTIDVEDYFHVSAFDDVIHPGDWGRCESRVVHNTRNLLLLLNDVKVKATFFVMGWVAEKHPEIIREILQHGHEIGCHSYLHRKVYELSPAEFREDTRKAKAILEKITNKKVIGYRAPSYSITNKSLWALGILEEEGFLYDSSVFPIYHDIYGIPDAPRFKYRWPENKLTEIPISTARFLGRNFPVAGGGYFRLLPYWLTKKLLRQINEKEDQPFIFYLHPWEIDPEQPRIKGARLLSKFRHYNNLTKTAERFKRLLDDFSFGPIGNSF